VGVVVTEAKEEKISSGIYQIHAIDYTASDAIIAYVAL
jgi:hypothetical protein